MSTRRGLCVSPPGRCRNNSKKQDVKHNFILIRCRWAAGRPCPRNDKRTPHRRRIVIVSVLSLIHAYMYVLRTIPTRFALDVGLNGSQASTWRSIATIKLHSFWFVSFALSCKQCLHCRNVFSSVTLPARHSSAPAILISWLLCSEPGRSVVPSFRTHHHRKFSPFLTKPFQPQTSIPRLQTVGIPLRVQARLQAKLL